MREKQVNEKQVKEKENDGDWKENGIDNGDKDEAFKLEMNEGDIVIPSSKHLKDSSCHA